MKTKRPSERNSPVKKIQDLLGTIEQKLDLDFKFTVADYIRLLQLKEAFEHETPRNIEVTWVDALEPSDSEK